jgi:hypothetical protein
MREGGQAKGVRLALKVKAGMRIVAGRIRGEEGKGEAAEGS